MARICFHPTLVPCLVLSFFLTSALHSQDRAQIQADRQINDAVAKTSEAKNKKFASQFWKYLLANNYKHWSPVPGKTAEHFELQNFPDQKMSGQNPHGALLKTYMNRTAAGEPGSLPVGSVLIVENYRPDKSLQSISAMYRTEGFNPKANDWYWVNFNPDGSVASSAIDSDLIDGPIVIDANGVGQTFVSARTAPVVKLVGRAQSCIECHKQSGGNDLVFFNDDRARPDRVAANRSNDEQK